MDAPKRRNYALLLREDDDAGDGASSAAAILAATLTPPPSSIFLDVGCGSGRFLLLLARRLRRAQQQQTSAPMMMRALLETAAAATAAGTPNPPPPLLLLGIDAQPALVERASAWARALEEDDNDASNSPAPPRCRFVAGDAPRVVGALGGAGALAAASNTSLSPPTVVVGASINFPDPVLMVLDERRRGLADEQQQQQQRLRRCPALSEDLARLLGSRMAEGAPLLVQSECGRTAQAIVDVFSKSGALEVVLPPMPQDEDDDSNDAANDPDRPSWCWPFNPLGVPTEREVYLAERLSLGDTEQGRVWRAVFRRR
jgi:SAM-dependent methyltransferase